jgi:hypothetical protein
VLRADWLNSTPHPRSNRRHPCAQLRRHLADAQRRGAAGRSRCAPDSVRVRQDKTVEILPRWGEPVTISFTKRGRVPHLPTALLAQVMPNVHHSWCRPCVGRRGRVMRHKWRGCRGLHSHRRRPARRPRRGPSCPTWRLLPTSASEPWTRLAPAGLRSRRRCGGRRRDRDSPGEHRLAEAPASPPRRTQAGQGGQAGLAEDICTSRCSGPVGLPQADRGRDAGSVTRRRRAGISQALNDQRRSTSAAARTRGGCPSTPSTAANTSPRHPRARPLRCSPCARAVTAT